MNLDPVNSDNNNFNENLETKKAIKKISPTINIIDNYFKNLPQINLIKPNFRKYTLNKFKKTDNAYVTMIFGDETYIPGILVLGYSLKKYKCKYNLVCMVQDKPAKVKINDEIRDFPGVSSQTIKEILNIFDVVYGIDLIKTNSLKKNEKHFTEVFKHYKNISIYSTKIQSIGLIEYDKILFLDASLVAHKNIDYLFKDYDDFTFLLNSIIGKTNMGIHGAIFLIKPSLYLYNKALFLSKNYIKIFNNLYFKRGIDEVLLYLTIYPNWSNKLFKLWTRCNEKYYFKKCSIYHYQIHKPFRKSENKQNDTITFKIWDKFAKEFLIKYPNYSKYFEHIKTFRNVDY
jgi:hypothetical protein